jgi:ketosteroid isomerase-like protein
VKAIKQLTCACALLIGMHSLAWSAGEEEKAMAIQAFKNYVAEVGSLDAQRVAAYYHEPLMFVTTARAGAFNTRAEIEAWLKSVFAGMKQRGYARSDWSDFHAKMLSAGVAVISTQTVRYKADGQELERLGFTYLLRKTGDGWKVAVLVGHDPSNVLKLD